MQVICLEEAAIYELFDQIVEMLRATQSERLERRLPEGSGHAAFKYQIENHSSKAPGRRKNYAFPTAEKVILYDRTSIEA
ncbi:hypothetical protein [Dyadobacter sp. OTU695]|uniref:hypothetical protein n=1 Tax=Dyadobacter sp. OTU695 TaxID=3043860 RepID=UPI00313B390F